MPYDFSLKGKIDYKIARLGAEAEPLIMIDGLMKNAPSMVEYAAKEAGYGPAGAAYPGLRAAIPAEYSQNLYAGLKPLLYQVYGIPDTITLMMDSSFALVTEHPKTLAHNQRVPHTDRSAAYCLAFVHYLCGPEFGGTAFFRHRSSGWQRISEDREGEYNETVRLEMNKQILPNAFPGENHPFFERLAAIESSFDRLIIYRSSILHSPAIAPDAHFSDDPHKGRLTITSFLNPTS